MQQFRAHRSVFDPDRFLCALRCFHHQCPADARRFTYIYEATTEEPGEVEMENWITWGTSPRDERRFNAVDFRHEIEFGVIDHLQMGLYLADWGYRDDPAANEHGFRYQSSALELIYNLTNPATDLLGLALYGEVRGGPKELELEFEGHPAKEFRPLGSRVQRHAGSKVGRKSPGKRGRRILAIARSELRAFTLRADRRGVSP
jgi:hypothetical protein